MSTTRVGRLKEVFGSDETSILFNIARLSVLYEDLRIECECAKAPHGSLGAADALGLEYRLPYFLRRSLVTWLEFRNALLRVSRTAEFEQLPPDSLAKIKVLEALAFFHQREPRIKELRDEFGGHLLPEGMAFALRQMPLDRSAKIVWDTTNPSFCLELHFAKDLIAGVFSSKLQGGTSPEDELKAALDEILGAIPVIYEVTCRLMLDFVWPRFGR